MLGVKSLFTSLLVEKNDRTAAKIYYFLIIVLKFLLIFVTCTYRVGKLPANSILHASLSVLTAYSIHPLQLNFDFVRCLQIVVHSDTLEPVGDYWLQCCV